MPIMKVMMTMMTMTTRVPIDGLFLLRCFLPPIIRLFATQHAPRTLSTLYQMGKQHGSLARAGKVKNQTPKVAKKEQSKKAVGRAKKRITYNKRFLTNPVAPGQKRKMNPQEAGKRS